MSRKEKDKTGRVREREGGEREGGEGGGERERERVSGHEEECSWYVSHSG